MIEIRPVILHGKTKQTKQNQAVEKLNLCFDFSVVKNLSVC